MSSTRTPSPDALLFAGLLGLVVWVPLPLGSNRPWAWAILEIWVYLLAVLWLFALVRGRVALTPVFRFARVPLLLLALWIAYVGMQIVPLPISWLASISPEAARAHAAAVFPGPAPAYATISVDPHVTAEGWLKSLAYALVFALVLLLARKRSRVKQLALALVLGGLCQATYGSLMTLSGAEYGFFYRKDSYLGVATGTFVNRNHLAGYLEMCLAVGIGMLIATLEEARGMGWRQRLRDVAQLFVSAKIRLRLSLAVMVIALVLTHSRMGNMAFFGSMLVASAAGFALSRYATRPAMILLASLMLIDLAIVGTWFGVEKVVDRIGHTTMAAELRDEVYSYAAEQWKDHLFVGSGLGTFYAVFPRYRGGDVAAYYDHAHNDYLQFGAETGVVGITLLGLLVASSLGAALLAQYRRRDPLMRGLGFAGVMGITAILIHSATDFNLQIPANAMTFMILLALAWIALYFKSAFPSEAAP